MSQRSPKPINPVDSDLQLDDNSIKPLGSKYYFWPNSDRNSTCALAQRSREPPENPFIKGVRL